MCFRIKYLSAVFFDSNSDFIWRNRTNETNRTNRRMNKKSYHLWRIKILSAIHRQASFCRKKCINLWIEIKLPALHPNMFFKWLFTLNVQIEKFVCLPLWFTPRKIFSLISKDLNVWLQDYPLHWDRIWRRDLMFRTIKDV